MLLHKVTKIYKKALIFTIYNKYYILSTKGYEKFIKML